MNNGNRPNSIKELPSFDSSTNKLTSSNSILTSTRNQEDQRKSFTNKYGRKALIPSTFISESVKKTLSMNQEQEKKFIENRQKPNKTEEIDNTHIENSLIETDNIDDNMHKKFSEMSMNIVDDQSTKPFHFVNKDGDNKLNFNDIDPTDDQKTTMNKKQFVTQVDFENVEKEKEMDTQSQTEENIDEFDAFILENFTPFSGQQNVIQWLDTTETKFNQFRINRALRFQAISLLLVSDAKRIYIKHRKTIQSFEDFYEFLLVSFDSSDTSQNQATYHSNITRNTPNFSSTNQPTSSFNIKSQPMNLSDIPNLTNQSSMSSVGPNVDHGSTNLVGDTSAAQSTTIPNNNSTLVLDDTTSDLRKAIVGNLIKNPKTFKGGKDDVKKWIEEIEHLFDVAHIQDSTRLDLISYSLRGDALEWFKANRLTLNTWKVFVLELKKAFTSSFHEEVAFKKLESYSQSENQSIRNFFTEVLKLCKEADPAMSETTKLKNLLNKTIPTIQFEVRKKKPTTTTEFLEYAKEAEELFQLSNITLDNTISPNIQSASHQQIPSLLSNPITPGNQLFNNSRNNYRSTYSQNPNQKNHSSNNQYSNFNYKSSADSSTRPQSFQNKSRSNYNNTYTNRYQSQTNRNDNANTQQQPTRTNSSHNNYQNQRTANSIGPFYSSPIEESQPEQFAPTPCYRCNDFGHEAPACPYF